MTGGIIFIPRKIGIISNTYGFRGIEQFPLILEQYQTLRFEKEFFWKQGGIKAKNIDLNKHSNFVRGVVFLYYLYIYICIYIYYIFLGNKRGNNWGIIF